MLIETKRLYLRPFEKSDLDDLFQLARDPEVMRFSIAGPHTREMTKERLIEMIAMQEKFGYSPFPAFKKDNNKFMGYCGIQNHEIEGKRELEITYRLLPSYWGKWIRIGSRYSLQALRISNSGCGKGDLANRTREYQIH